MKKQIISLKFAMAVLLVFSITLSSCKKGDTGPAGTTGNAGKDGNANVKSISVFINANEWIYKPGVCEVTKLVPEITADIVNKGAVLVYDEGSTAGSWEALPTTVANYQLTLAIGYSIETGKLNLTATFDANATLAAGSIPSGNYKVVLMAGSARLANPNVNLTEYKEVKTAFNLSE